MTLKLGCKTVAQGSKVDKDGFEQWKAKYTNLPAFHSDLGANEYLLRENIVTVSLTWPLMILITRVKINWK